MNKFSDKHEENLIDNLHTKQMQMQSWQLIQQKKSNHISFSIFFIL